MISKEMVFEKNKSKLLDKSTTSVKFKEDLYDYFGDNYLDKSILELGTHEGYSTRFFSFLFKEVHTVDKLKEYLENAAKLCDDRNNITFWEGDLYNPGVHFELSSGHRIPSLFGDLPKNISVVFIDASHLYPHVFMDAINSILYFDKPIIIFDDYGYEYPVKKAVDHLVELKLLKIVQKIGHSKDEIINPHNNRKLFDSEGVICKVLI